jgi:DNA-directed RNA polymerase III subunit RPC1
MNAMYKMMLQGISTIQRAVINIKEGDDAKGKKGDKELLVEGYGLQKVMVTEGSFLFFSSFFFWGGDRK